MGRELKSLIDNVQVPVVNNLTSDSTTDALSAAQGKELKRLIDALEAKLSEYARLDTANTWTEHQTFSGGAGE
jgi:hypothetical protein